MGSGEGECRSLGAQGAGWAGERPGAGARAAPALPSVSDFSVVSFISFPIWASQAPEGMWVEALGVGLTCSVSSCSHSEGGQSLLGRPETTVECGGHWSPLLVVLQVVSDEKGEFLWPRRPSWRRVALGKGGLCRQRPAAVQSLASAPRWPAGRNAGTSSPGTPRELGTGAPARSGVSFLSRRWVSGLCC